MKRTSNHSEQRLFREEVLSFTRLFVPQASQSSHYRRTESEIQFAIPSAQGCLRNGDWCENKIFHTRDLCLRAPDTNSYASEKCAEMEITMKENRKLLKEVLADIRHDMTDEEILNLLADSKISMNPEKEQKITLGQKAADAIARFAGSWAFIFSFTGVLILWMLVNTLLASKAFDPYPFILLNLVLSCVAAIQAPLIMMSQNRQEEKDRHRAENDYKVNLKTEIMIEDLYDKVNIILAKQTALEKKIEKQ